MFRNLEWFGRQLNSYTIPDDAETTDVNESLNVSYTYDADGLRTSKTVDGAKTTYQYVGDKLYYLCAKDADGNTSYEMYFFYDSYDKLTVLKYFLHTVEDENNVVKEFTYYVATNYFGDVVGLYDGEGNILNSYEYDAWGNVIGVYKHEHSTDDEGKPVISTVENTDLNSIAHRNPIRYRSYYYDTETGLYYLQSRYYNAEIGRFLNADGYVTTGQGLLSYNMFVYCGNNPVNRSDSTGAFWKSIRASFLSACETVKTFLKNAFGHCHSETATIAKIETPIVPDPSPITVKKGTTTQQSILETNTDSKPVLFFTTMDIQNPMLSSCAGVEFNVSNFTLKLSLGLEDTGISGSFKNNNIKNSLGIRLNLSELKLGIENSSEIEWDTITETSYTNISYSGWAIVAAYAYVTTGAPVSAPAYS